MIESQTKEARRRAEAACDEGTGSRLRKGARVIAWERNRRHLGTFDSARLEEEGPDGTYLVIGTTDAEVTLRVHAEDVQALDAALQPLRDYLADKAREKIAYDAAKRTSERARSLLLEGAREAYGGSANEYEVEWDADGWEER